MVRFSCLLWQSSGSLVALCRRDLNNMCWLMLLRMCENSAWRRNDSWTLLPAEHLNGQLSWTVYTLAGSQRLTQDVRETTNYVVRCTNEPTVQTTSEGTLSCTTLLHDTRLWVSWRSTWQAVPRQPSDYHRPKPDFRLPARGKRVQRQPPDYRPLSSGFHFASPISNRTVACYVFVCCCAFMF